MSRRKVGSIIMGTATLIVIGYAIYRGLTGNEIGFNEVFSIAAILSIFLSSITWGSKQEKDGILQEEELGQRITEKSSKLSYLLLTIFILGAVGLDTYINGTVNMFLLALLGLSVILLPIVEFFYARRYQ
ncbi:hypothetical protein [Paenibacillus sp. 481]|uniref:hypothetical protein n=1 Tax=Paenibacillus sp. 481 TaxID=2835869 RepID=UPI001E47DF2F|nr:hypothetical protein [Paenibacillus sp. 481]UHA74697.1 hypothetical protein KIK04_06385 [Paenibacillus sp. 481]